MGNFAARWDPIMKVSNFAKGVLSVIMMLPACRTRTLINELTEENDRHQNIRVFIIGNCLTICLTTVHLINWRFIEARLYMNTTIEVETKCWILLSLVSIICKKLENNPLYCLWSWILINLFIPDLWRNLFSDFW